MAAQKTGLKHRSPSSTEPHGLLQRKGESLPITNLAADYKPGDLVTWDLGRNVPHIGIVVDRKAASGHYMIVHNIGQGPRMEDVLLSWKTTGHYRYFGPKG